MSQSHSTSRSPCPPMEYLNLCGGQRDLLQRTMIIYKVVVLVLLCFNVFSPLSFPKTSAITCSYDLFPWLTYSTRVPVLQSFTQFISPSLTFPYFALCCFSDLFPFAVENSHLRPREPGLDQLHLGLLRPLEVHFKENITTSLSLSQPLRVTASY